MKIVLKQCPKCKDNIKPLGFGMHIKYCKGIFKDAQKNVEKQDFYKCEKCGDKISKFAFNKHFNSCNGIFKDLRNENRVSEKLNKISIKINKDLFECRKCKKQYTKSGICSHFYRNHTKKGKELKYKIWNTGLTKETDNRVLKSSIKLKEGYKSGRLIGSFVGKKHSKKTRKLLSINKIKFLKENPDKVPYLLNHSSKGDSFPEKLFEKGLLESNILGWTKKYRFEIYEFDFAFVDLKINIEIDGNTHSNLKVIKIDKKRDKNSIKNGWIVLRFKASEVRSNLKDCIIKVLETIKNRSKEFNYDLSNLNKIYNKQDIKNIKLLELQKLKLEKEKLRLKIIEDRKQLILNSGIDLNKRDRKSVV